MSTKVVYPLMAVREGYASEDEPKRTVSLAWPSVQLRCSGFIIDDTAQDREIAQRQRFALLPLHHSAEEPRAIVKYPETSPE